MPFISADPGINGIHKTRPDGQQSPSMTRLKQRLMSYIIKGILNRQLPWGLVLLGSDDRHRARDERNSFAGFCGRCLSAAVLVEPDLHRRHDSLGRRSLFAQETKDKKLTKMNWSPRLTRVRVF